MKSREIHPVVKWAGGKGQLIEEIERKYPIRLGNGINKYAEPFIGGGAVLFDILSKYDLDEVYISDINAELINMYIQIKDNVDELIRLLNVYQEEYLPLNMDDRAAYFYVKRDRYNELIQNGHSKDTVESAALFIFLNRTCFNGLYRVNRKGLYNVPSGKYKNPRICDEDNLRAVSDALKKVTIVCGDYRESADFIDNNTFVYFDPPYRPLTETSSFTSYTENEFDDKSQIELAEYVQLLTERGASVVVSNSDPKNVSPDDDFFDTLYSMQFINRISANRMINSNGAGRGKISELLISNY